MSEPKTAQGLEPALLDEKQVAEVLNCSEATVSRLRLRGTLTFVRVGRLVRFRPYDLSQYLSRHEQKQAAAIA